jgi:Domain of unknown function (DUF4129)
MFPLNVPIDIGRDSAAEAARRELSKAVYAAGRPSLEQRAVIWVIDKIAGALGAAASVVPGGAIGLVALVAVLAVVIVVVVRRTGPLRRTATADAPLFVGRPRSAAQYRSAADAAAALCDWDEAVLQRFRAVVRSIEERDILDARPGRTADEAAAEAGLSLPSCAARLRSAARSFDDVAYGGRPGDHQADTDLRELDRQLSAARPVDDRTDLSPDLASLR